LKVGRPTMLRKQRDYDRSRRHEAMIGVGEEQV
jgi:hypothetical protein